jgi:hypothetical protein
MEKLENPQPALPTQVPEKPAGLGATGAAGVFPGTDGVVIGGLVVGVVGVTDGDGAVKVGDVGETGVVGV